MAFVFPEPPAVAWTGWRRVLTQKVQSCTRYRLARLLQKITEMTVRLSREAALLWSQSATVSVSGWQLLQRWQASQTSLKTSCWLATRNVLGHSLLQLPGMCSNSNGLRLVGFLLPLTHCVTRRVRKARVLCGLFVSVRYFRGTWRNWHLLILQKFLGLL